MKVLVLRTFQSKIDIYQEVQSPEIMRSLKHNLFQHVKNMQVPNGTGPGAQGVSVPYWHNTSNTICTVQLTQTLSFTVLASFRGY